MFGLPNKWWPNLLVVVAVTYRPCPAVKAVICIGIHKILHSAGGIAQLVVPNVYTQFVLG